MADPVAVADASGRDAPAGRVPPSDRGSTTIADRVVAKIAARAAREALPGVPDDGAPPHAMVVVHHETARVRVSLELEYPTDIGAQCGAVRRRVIERVKALAGMEVPEVAVHVERLHSALSRGTAQGRIR
ncbi:Asp23/Gls24 family envelope stress response protein [Streptomyces sp. NPDC054847]